jgi:exopolyphosphatase/guanosine-5'-triphosphate,3'-diphosphate pyrophosphatase
MTVAHLNRIACVDIGSNSVRLIIHEWDGERKKWKKINSYKKACGLAKDMTRQNPKLNAKGRKDTEEVLALFKEKIAEYGVVKVYAVATAAMRNVAGTKEGKEFHGSMKKILGHNIEIISGEKEACLSSIGAIMGLKITNGLIFDLGGGSLDFTQVRNGRIIRAGSIPLGTHTLARASRNRRPETLFRAELRKFYWLASGASRAYFIGGSCRAIARIIQIKLKQSGRKVHGAHFTASAALRIIDDVTAMQPHDFRNMDPHIKARAPRIPTAATILAAVMRHVHPRSMIFSGRGLRDGMIYSDQAANFCSPAVLQACFSGSEAPTRRALAPTPDRRTTRAASL